MKTQVKQWIALTGMVASGAMFGGGGCSLVDNFWIDKQAEIFNGLILGVVNIALATAGVPIVV